MTRHGFEFQTRADIFAWLSGGTDPLETELDALARRAAGTGQKPSISSELLDEIAPVRVDEMSVANADAGCSTEVNLSQRLRQRRIEAEEDFIDEHGDRIALALEQDPRSTGG